MKWRAVLSVNFATLNPSIYLNNYTEDDVFILKSETIFNAYRIQVEVVSCVECHIFHLLCENKYLWYQFKFLFRNVTRYTREW
jgi:hypothetical protein